MTIKPAVSSHGEKVGDSSPAVVKVENPKSLEKITGSSSAPVEDATPLVNNESEVAKQATVNKSGSFNEEQKQPSKKAMSLPVEKVLICLFICFLFFFFFVFFRAS